MLHEQWIKWVGFVFIVFIFWILYIVFFHQILNVFCGLVRSVWSWSNGWVDSGWGSHRAPGPTVKPAGCKARPPGSESGSATFRWPAQLKHSFCKVSASQTCSDQSPTDEKKWRDDYRCSDLWMEELAARLVPSGKRSVLASSGNPSLNRGVIELELGNWNLYGQEQSEEWMLQLFDIDDRSSRHCFLQCDD